MRPGEYSIISILLEIRTVPYDYYLKSKNKTLSNKYLHAYSEQVECEYVHSRHAS